MNIPKLTVDGIVYKNNKILLIKRKNSPFKGKWALPGGFVDYGETVENAVIRELKEETNLHVYIKKLHGIYSLPNRDPRGHVITIVYILDTYEKPLPGDDAEETRFFDIDGLPSLAFDHKKIIEDFLAKD